MDDLSEADWPSWSSLQSELLIDGLTVTQVFSNVHIQLETLRKRKFATKAGLLFEDELNNLANTVLKLGGLSVEKIVPIEQKIKVVERRIDGLDDAVSDKSDLQKLEIKLGGRIDGLERRLTSVEAALTQLGSGFANGTDGTNGINGVNGSRSANGTNGRKGTSGAPGIGADFSFMARLEALENQMEDMVVKVPSFEENLRSLNNQFDSIKKQLDTLPKKVSVLSDSCSISQYKIDGLEKLLAEVQTGYDRLKIAMNKVTDECVSKVKIEMEVLDEIKANKTDMNRKIDLSQLTLKADLVEVSLLNDLSNQLDRRIDVNKAEANEAMKILRNNYDKRLEALLQWILKQLRRISGNGKRGSESGTDIGKVKCLVCDQTVTQLVETDIVFGGPALPSSLKVLSNTRPMPFENDMEPRRMHNLTQQPWSRGTNRSPSALNQTNGSPIDPRLSSQDNDDSHEAFNRERPRSANIPRQVPPQPYLDNNRSMSFSSMGAAGAHNSHEQANDGAAPAIERKLSLFKELEL